MRFSIMETNEEIVAQNRPFVVITSNNEKELPDAFLRRCVFHFIDFPEPELMKRIVRVHHPAIDDAIVDQAIGAFYDLRAVSASAKAPEHERADHWIAVLAKSGVGEDRIRSGCRSAAV